MLDEPICSEHISTKLMKRVTVELYADGSTETVKLTVPAEKATMQELDQALRKILRENGKGEMFDWG